MNKKLSFLIATAILGASAAGGYVYCQQQAKQQAEKLAIQYMNVKRLFDDEKYHEALSQFQPLAAQGHAPSQFTLYKMYSEGKGVRYNLEQAVFWLQKAAENGETDAQAILAQHYRQGKGVNHDLKLVVHWLEKAAKANHAEGLNHLGELYRDGIGVQKNIKKAVELFEKSAEQNNADANWNLALLYKEGDGVEKDEKNISNTKHKQHFGEIKMLSMLLEIHLIS